MPLSTYLENVPEGFSEPKKKLLYYLKIMQQAGLEELANVMKVSRMAVHKHLDLLQQRGLVEGIETRGHVGRPRMVYQLTSQSKSVFPKSYGAIATHALDFIERNMGKEGVKKVLYERQGELFDQYYSVLRVWILINKSKNWLELEMRKDILLNPDQRVTENMSS